MAVEFPNADVADACAASLYGLKYEYNVTMCNIGMCVGVLAMCFSGL
jgi:hypothetical protein